MKTRKTVVAAVVGAVLIAGISGCKKEGPAERAGKEIDRTVEKFEKEMDKAGQKIEEALKLKRTGVRMPAIYSDGLCRTSIDYFPAPDPQPETPPPTS